MEIITAQNMIDGLPSFFPLIGFGLALGIFAWLLSYGISICLRLFRA